MKAKIDPTYIEGCFQQEELALPEIIKLCPKCKTDVTVEGSGSDLYGNSNYPIIYFICPECDCEFEFEMDVTLVEYEFTIKEIDDDDDNDI